MAHVKPTRIAILGWGSLLWEGGDEFDRWHGPWLFDGPRLRLEFSRISKSRLGALTLVIDTEHGATNAVAWSLSKRKGAEGVIADLRCREGTEVQNIKHVVATEPQPQDETARAIWTWAREKELDVVVWTGLLSNFANKRKRPYSIEAAKLYLKELTAESKSKAAEYIRRAPDFLQTPLRYAMEAESWFSNTAAQEETPLDTFQGLREDKNPKEVVREEATSGSGKSKSKPRRSR